MANLHYYYCITVLHFDLRQRSIHAHPRGALQQRIVIFFVILLVTLSIFASIVILLVTLAIFAGIVIFTVCIIVILTLFFVVFILVIIILGSLPFILLCD